MHDVIGVDVGGTTIKAGLVRNHEIIRLVAIPTEPERGRPAVIQNLVTAINQVRESQVDEVGIGWPGFVDASRGYVEETTNIPVHRCFLAHELRKELGLKVLIDNDAKCFSMAEAAHGAGKGFHTVIGITLGTGVGGALVVDGMVHRGRGFAGEYGAMLLSVTDGSGQLSAAGTLEGYLGAQALVKQARHAGLRVSSPEQIFHLAAQKNPKARAIFDRFGAILGIGITNVIYCVDPDVVVVGGAVCKAWRFFAPTMKRMIKQRCLFAGTLVMRSDLANAGIVGAAMLCTGAKRAAGKG